MTTERVDRCPTCGSVVRVLSADDDLGGDIVTSFYQPMQDEELRTTIERLTADNRQLKATCEYWREQAHYWAKPEQVHYPPMPGQKQL